MLFRKLVVSGVLAATSMMALDVGVAVAEPEAIALRGGETADLGAVWWIANCQSVLKSTPVVEVMEGPADLTAAVKAQKVMPRSAKCAKQVDGGELTISASPDIKSREQGKLFLRIKYATKDGERQKSREIDYTLFPKQ